MNQNMIPYELSVWDTVNDQSNAQSGGIEKRSVILGSNTMTFGGQASNIKLTQFLNGDKKLSFTLKDHFYEQGDKVDNYLIPFLFNEVKIKLHYKDEWFDFIVKNIEESHSRGILSYIYSCDYLPINELSKNGWSLNFSEARGNCTGTLNKFVTEILTGTDWEMPTINENLDLSEYSTEILYQTRIGCDLIVEAGSGELDELVEKVIGATEVPLVPKNGLIYIPYSEYQTLETKGNEDTIQVLVSNNDSIDNYTVTGTNYLIAKKLLPPLQGITLSLLYGDKKILHRPTYWHPGLKKWVSAYQDINDHLCFGFPNTLYRIDDQIDNVESPDLKIAPFNVTSYITTTVSLKGIGLTQEKINQGLKEEVPTMPILNANSESDLLPEGAKSGQIAIVYDESEIKDKGTTITKIIEKVYIYTGAQWQESVLSTLNFVGGAKYPLYLHSEVTNFAKTQGEESNFNGLRFNMANNGHEQDTAEKIRTLIEEKSNRFNLIQKVAELFEVQAHFKYEHNDKGQITNKQIYFTNGVGNSSGIGFYYGTNLKGIKRQIISNELSTKLYVEPVDCATIDSGYCAIQDAIDNISGEAFLINFDYFVQKQLLNENQVLDDLYGTDSHDFGYLPALKVQNEKIKEAQAELSGQDGLYNRLNIIIRSKLDYYDAAIRACDNSEEKRKTALETKRAEWEKARKATEEEINGKETIIRDAREAKESLHKTFYSKYSQYIQEGSWSDGNYFNADSYYYDAQKVLQKSCKPLISYTIDVLNINNVITGIPSDPAFNVNYKLGDIGYVADEEFFGFTSDHGLYHEEIIISEISETLDDNAKSTITVRNYRNQFDDLFQRTTATVQSYQLNKNIYNRAGAISSKNEIKFDTLQNSFLNNSYILSASKNNDVIIDKNGIEVADPTNLKSIVRIVSGGVMISNNGGSDWTVGITGNGINANAIKAGQIEADKVNIIQSASLENFVRDEKGITARDKDDKGNKKTTFIRLNQQGLFASSDGIDGQPIGKLADETDMTFYDNKTNKYNKLPFNGDDAYKSFRPTFALIEEGLFMHSSAEVGSNIGHFYLDATPGALSISSNDGANNSTSINIGIEGNEPRISLESAKNRLVANSAGIALQCKDDSSENKNWSNWAQLEQNTFQLQGKILIQGIEPTTPDDYYLQVKDSQQNSTFEIKKDGTVSFPKGVAVNLQIEDEICIGPKGSIKNQDNSLLINATDFKWNSSIDHPAYFNGVQVGYGIFDSYIIVGPLSKYGLSSNNEHFNISPLSKLQGHLASDTTNETYAYSCKLISQMVNEPFDGQYYFFIKQGMILPNNQKYSGNNLFCMLNYQKKEDKESKDFIQMFFFSQTPETDGNLLITALNSGPQQEVAQDYWQSLFKQLEVIYWSPSAIIIDGLHGTIFSNQFFNNEGLLLSSDNVTVESGLFGNAIQATSDGVKIIGDLILEKNQDSTSTNNLITISPTNGIYQGVKNADGQINGQWQIGPDGHAYFNDVTVKGEIKSSIFSKKEVSLVGGDLLVQNSFSIDPKATKIEVNEEIGQNKIIVIKPIQEVSLENGKYCYCKNGSDIYYFQLNTTSGFKLLPLGNTTKNYINTLLDINTFPTLFVQTSNEKLSAAIRLSIEDDQAGMCMYSERLDYTNTNEPSLEQTPYLQLGYIDFDNKVVGANDLEIKSGYGLYADNVLLKGTLISQGMGYTSGISSNGIPIKKDGMKMGDQAIFWGGKKENGTPAFYVTNTGYLYAQQGYFSGTVEAATIKTAEIYNPGINQSSALKVVSLPNKDNSQSSVQFVLREQDAKDGSLDKTVMHFDKEGFLLNKLVENKPTLTSGFIAKTGILWAQENRSWYQGEDKITYGWKLLNNSLAFGRYENETIGQSAQSAALYGITTEKEQFDIKKDNVLSNQLELLAGQKGQEGLEIRINNNTSTLLKADLIQHNLPLYLNDTLNFNISTGHKVTYETYQNTNGENGYNIYIS